MSDAFCCEVLHLLVILINPVNDFWQNMNDETDDMYDELFKKYGNVVFKSNDQKPPSAEIDNDSESLSCK